MQNLLKSTIDAMDAKATEVAEQIKTTALCDYGCNTIFPIGSPISYEGIVLLIKEAKRRGLLNSKQSCREVVTKRAKLIALLTELALRDTLITLIVDYLGDTWRKMRL